MALEHFKTQVLLLHSQQSTLDVLSAGFGERYAVHCATSGTEALNTLGATPIHVIVSAQDLPGMSGLEALREAKKRSPDTIGILLAGSDRDDGLEALVGDKEVFQIVRGAISPEALRNLIDTATKRVRLLAISESANDLAANVDEPAGEHIVMETSENGSAIISDGTGKLPVLRPQKVQISPAAGGQNVDVLVLTKDEEFLETIKQSSRGLHNVHYANTPAQAETLVRNHKVGVLVTDAAMVGSNIEAVTLKLRTSVPRLVAIVAGRRDDGELLMDLINRGQVYRFLLKPVSPGRARLAIEASVKHHLEAGDSAFKGKARGDKRPDAPKTVQQPKVTPTIAPSTMAPPAPRSDAETRAGTQTPLPSSPADKGPADKDKGAGESLRNSGRFTETMTGLAASVGKSLSGASDSNLDGANPPGGGRSSALANPKVLIAAAGAVVVIAVVSWWMINGNDAAFDPAADHASANESGDPATNASTSVVETDIPQSEQLVNGAADATSQPAWQAALDNARLARDAGLLVAPPAQNAIELYIAARALAPDTAAIANELNAVLDQALGLAEAALLAQRTDDARTALRLVRLANPDHPRLPFLDAQVAELQYHVELDQTRAAIREGRFEDAATSLAAAEALAGDDKSDIVQLTNELASARSAQQIDDVLALASVRLGDDDLIAPANDNARYFYELALSTDPENTAAQQGLTIVASKLVLRGRDAIDAGRLDDAERFLREASELDPGSNELSASMQALTTARAGQDALRQADLKKQAAAEKAAAKALAGLSPAGAILPGAIPSGETADGAAAPLFVPGASGTFAPASAAAGTTGSPGNSSQLAVGNGPRLGERAGSSSADESASAADDYVPISSLTRTNYVVPDYPRSARRRNITGWVDVSFTVDTRGQVVEVGILRSDPDNVFNESAREAISKWRFEPPLENGIPVERRVAVRLSFNLQ